MFATYQDVADRYEGTIPDSRDNWVNLRIEDVESFLVGLVPSLAGPDVSPDRLRRAKVLVCDKVLEIYRNPDGSTQRSQVMGPMTDTRSWSKEVATGRITFTEEDLRQVREPVKKRRRIGSMQVSPWGVPS
jgi:hypothetical protein